MKIELAKMLKKLRQEQGNTQEELANHLNISVQAVSKWERREGCPDISLLPNIASFYGVTVDVLLGCDESRKEEAIQAFQKSCQEINHQGDMEGWLSLCRTVQKEYPKEERVLLELMYALVQNGIKENGNEILKLGQTLLQSTNAECRNSAIELLCYTYTALGERETAADYAAMIPVYEDLLVTVLSGKERAEHCKWNFWRFCDMMSLQLQYLLSAEENGYTAEEKHSLREMLHKMYHLIFAKGDFGFWEERLGRNRFQMAALSMECGKTDRALTELESMATHLERYEKFQEIDHCSLPVRGLHYEAKMAVKTDQVPIRFEYAKKLQQPCFDPLRKAERFIKVTERLEA